ncbi:MAG: pectin methylesterase [Culturomica sp.]|nr:pectin methylesterase [Culturomica sp.]
MKRIFLILITLLAIACESIEEKHNVIVVDKNGNGDYTTLSEAFLDLPNNPDKWTTIKVKPGIYREKLVLDVFKNKVKIIGEKPENTIIVWNDHTGKVVKGDTINTFTSYTFSIRSNDVILKNITIQNDAGQVGQAVACETRGDRILFDNCRFIGDQDTFFTGAERGRLYLKNCYIEGTTDYIFGPSIALFDDCLIHSKRNSYITAASTQERSKFGYVFRNCKFTVSSDVTKLYLGRPWRSFAQTVFINCELPAVIVPEGWHNWRSPEREKTTYYAEYHSSGEGANPDARVAWSHQLTDEEVARYTIKNIFAAKTGIEPFKEDWNPECLLDNK